MFSAFFFFWSSKSEIRFYFSFEQTKYVFKNRQVFKYKQKKDFIVYENQKH